MATEIITPEFLNNLTGKELFAWEELYDHYSACLYGVILQNVPTEISASVLEHVFIKIYIDIHEYQVEKERFFTWMYRLTLCSCALAKGGTMNISSFSPLPIFSQVANG